MSRLLNIIAPLIGLTTVVLLTIIAGLFAWLVGFLYARDRRTAPLFERIGALITLDDLDEPTAGDDREVRQPSGGTRRKRRVTWLGLPGISEPLVTLRSHAPTLGGAILVVSLALGAWAIHQRWPTATDRTRETTKTVIQRGRMAGHMIVDQASQGLAVVAGRLHRGSESTGPTSVSTPPAPVLMTVSGPVGPFFVGQAIAASPTKPTTTPTAQTQPVLGLSVTLPPDWQTTDSTSHSVTFSPNQSITLAVSRFTHDPAQSLETWARIRYSTPAFAGATPTTVSELAGYTFSRNNADTAERELLVIVSSGDTVWSVQLAAPMRLPADDPMWLAGATALTTVRHVTP